MAASALVEPGERVLVCAGPGVVEALTARGAVPVRDGDADAVLVGFHRDFDYERLRVASRAVRRGARLLAINDDASYPTPDGPIPGGGAILAVRPGIRRFEMSVTEVAALLASMVALGPSATDAARSATAALVDALVS